MVAASQVGKSEFMMNCMGYCIHQDPGSMMMVQPTIEDAKKFSTQRIKPMLRDTTVLRRRVKELSGKSKKDTLLQQTFPGGILTMVGSQSASALASTPVRYLFGDERDRWAKSAGKEGDPWLLAQARQTTFYNAKSVEVSTPTVKGASNIELGFSQGTQEHWCQQCPHCGQWHEIRFDDIHFVHTKHKVGKKISYTIDEEPAWVCPSCKELTLESDMRLQPARWIADNPDAYDKGVRSFWLNAFCSPWTSWTKICLQFLDAKDDPQRLQVVYNTLLGQLWEDRGDLADEDELMARRENYGIRPDGSVVEIPDGVLVLTCGVDTQDNRLEYEVVGHGYYGETWGVQRGFIMGRPDTDEPWQKLDDILDHVYRYPSGRGLKISITCVDSGGHMTQDVYEQCKKRLNRRVLAIKGRGGEGVPYVSIPSKVPIRDSKRNTAWLYTIGVDDGKRKIMDDLRVQDPGARFCHFPSDPTAGYDSNFFNGLLSEKLELQDRKWKWVKLPGHIRNEPLDCRNYALAAFAILHPDLEAVERRLKEIEKPKESIPAATKTAPKAKKSRKKAADKYFSDW